MMSWHPHPILLAQRLQGAPARRFSEEILHQQGYHQTDTVNLDEVTLASELEGRAVCVLSAASLTSAEREALATYLRQGGRALLLAPPPNLMSALGLSLSQPLHGTYDHPPDGYVVLGDHPIAGAHAGQVVQAPTEFMLMRLASDGPVARYAADPDEPIEAAAIDAIPVGEGRAVIFWFDPGEASVYLRQGKPLHAHHRHSPDPRVRKATTLLNGVTDRRFKDVPQADVLADLLVGSLRWLTDDILPLPRTWFFPDAAPAVTLLDGDSDGYDSESYHSLADPAAEAGVPYTLNLLPGHVDSFDEQEAAAAEQLGHDFQLHYHYPGWLPNQCEVEEAIASQQAQFEARFGRRSACSRAHSLLWPGYTETAAALATHGATMETNFGLMRGYRYGYPGSARPSRFLDEHGHFIPLLQQSTVFMDDPLTSDKCLMPPLGPEAAAELIRRTYRASAERYHGAICTCLHPVSADQVACRYREVQPAMLEAILAVTAELGLPAFSQGDWAAFHEARRHCDLRWSSTGWRLAGQVPGLTLLYPAEGGLRRQGHFWHREGVDVNSGK